MKDKSKRKLVLLVIILMALATVGYWFFFVHHTLPEQPVRQEDITTTIQNGYCIVKAGVKSRKITNVGTRSESAYYNLLIRSVFHGDIPDTIIITARYTQNQKHYLRNGENYLLVLKPKSAPGGKAYSLVRFEIWTEERLAAVDQWLSELRNK